MQFNYTNSIVLPIQSIHYYLRTNTYTSFLQNTKVFWWIFGEHFILKHFITRDCNYGIIRIWKTNINSNLYIENMDKDNCVASLDYFIGYNTIEIEYVNIQDRQCSKMIDDKLYFSCNEKTLFIHSLLIYIGNIAKEKNIKKIIVGVHPNLKAYNQYYKHEGFVLTKNRSKSNKYNMEAELSI